MKGLYIGGAVLNMGRGRRFGNWRWRRGSWRGRRFGASINHVAHVENHSMSSSLSSS